MQAGHEERMSRQAQAEVRFVGIAVRIARPAHATAHVEIMQALQLRPQQRLETSLVRVVRAIEQGNEREQRMVARIVLEPRDEVPQRIEQRRVVGTVAEARELVHLDAVARQRTLGAHAGERVVPHQVHEVRADRVLAR